MTSQQRAVPRPSQPPRGLPRDRSPSQGLGAKKKAEPKKVVDSPKEEEKDSPQGELQRTPKNKEKKKRKDRSRTSASSSSVGGGEKRKREEKRRRRIKRSEGGQSVLAAPCRDQE